VVMGEVPSPPSQLIDSSTRTVSLEVDTEGHQLQNDEAQQPPRTRAQTAKHRFSLANVRQHRVLPRSGSPGVLPSRDRQAPHPPVAVRVVKIDQRD
jgi:hypothetical protein